MMLVQVPLLVDELTGQKVTKAAAGFTHSAVLTEDGLLYTYGQNDSGQLGCEAGSVVDTHAMEVAPVLIQGDTMEGRRVKDIACGFKSTIISTDQGQVIYTGDRVHTQPTEITGDERCFSPNNIIEVAAGKRAQVAINDQGEAFSWGQNGKFLGLGSTEKEKFPVKMEELNAHGKVIKIVGGYGRMAAAVLPHDA